jgi:glycogen synthase
MYIQVSYCFNDCVKQLAEIEQKQKSCGWQVAFCVHNIAYQGRFAFGEFAKLGLPDKFRGSFDFLDGYRSQPTVA